MTEEPKEKKYPKLRAGPDSVALSLCEATRGSAISLLRDNGVLNSALKLNEELGRLDSVRRATTLGRADYGSMTRASLVQEALFATIERRDQALNTIIGSTSVFAKLDGLHGVAFEQVNKLKIATQAIMAPLAEVRALSIKLGSSKAMGIASTKLNAYENLFKLPRVSEIAALNISTNLNSSLASLTGINVQTAAAAIRSPWLKIESPARSAFALAELHGIARATVTFDPFGDRLMAGLRSNLGDWRDYAAVSPVAIPDLSARSNFYIERGFRPELTDFPSAAFETSLEVAELTLEPPSLVDQYGEPIEPSESEDISAFVRTNTAHLWLLRFETQFREFINDCMTKAYGADWPRQKLPNGLYEKWKDKQEKSEKAGKPKRPIIVFADFTDYELIICKRDNWKHFAPYFGDAANIRESLLRLQLPRIEAMHARPLSQDDELFLFVELKRLGKAFKS